MFPNKKFPVLEFLKFLAMHFLQYYNQEKLVAKPYALHKKFYQVQIG